MSGKIKSNKNNIRKLLIYVISLLIVLGFICILVMGKTQTIKKGKKLVIDNDLSKVSIKVDEVKKGVKLESIIAGTPTEVFTKIKITVDNNGKMPTLLSTFITFELHNKKNKKLTSCSNLSFLLKDEEDLIKDVQPGKSETGYIYCKTDSLEGSKLLVTALTGIDAKKSEKGILEGTGYDKYYINLK